jgi:two-component sensor histidine kinase
MEEMLKESINRIISIAAVHDLLSKEDLDQVSLRQVAETILHLNAQSLLRPGQEVRTRVLGEEVFLPSSKATSIALVLNELIHNAIEHGFPDETGGRLEVHVTHPENQIQVEIVNDGRPLPPDFDPKGSDSLGLQIVESLTQNDLGGRFTLKTEELTRATVVFTV